MKRRFTILTAALALLAILAIPMGMMGQTRESYNVTYSYDDLGDMLYGSYLDASSYWKVPETSGNNAVISIPITYQPESDITVTFRIATFGSGNNPSSSNTTITAAGTESNSNWSGSGVSTYPSSSTYVNGVMTITKPQNPTTLGGLDITMGVNTGVKIFRLQSVIVSYTYGGGTPTPTTYTVTYDCNGGTSGCPQNLTGLEAGDEITLADGPVKDGFDFAGWSDGNTTYDEGDTYNVNSDVTFTAQWTAQSTGNEQWVLTNLADLTASDVFVIVGNNGSNYAMKNSGASNSGPVVVAVTVSGTELTGTIGDDIKWNITGDATNGYIFYPNGSSTTWLYCIDNNNGLRIGSGNTDYNTFKIQSDYIYNIGRGRYIGIYSNTNWRSYTSINSNIAGQTFAFYKKVTSGVVPPSITANSVEIGYNATSGSITYTINNEPSPAGTLTAAVTDGNWLTLGQGTTSPIAFTCSANANTTARTATVTLTYTYDTDQTVTANVTVTQGAAPVSYTTIPDLFAAATSTETPVYVTFNNWVVSGISTNGKNVFVTDNNGNGFVIYGTDMNNNYTVGDILTGTAVSCNLKKYNGFAELLNVTASDLTITSGGTVSTANVALADLSGINTGALLHYEGLTCDVRTNSEGTSTYYYLTDGTTDIQVYNAIYAFGTLVDGKTYNITGIYQQYNTTKEILPRSANDIEEVVVVEPSVTVTPNTISAPFAGAEGTLALTYENIEFISFDYYFCDANGNQLEDTDPDYPGDWIYAEINDENEAYTLSYIIDANDGAARTAYMKVYTFDDNLEEVSAIVTVNQAQYVVDYATLPFEWEGGASADFLALNGVTAHGLGSDYASSNAPYLIKLDGTGDYIQVKTNEQPGKVTIDVKMLGGDITSYITIQGSADGETFTDIEELTISGDKNDVLTLETTNAFAANVRYVRMLFTKGSNVGVGPITIAKPAYTLEIAGYEAGNDGGYYLIASPVTVNPANVEGMTDGEYDLYSFDQAQDDEWRNYKQNAFNLEPGKGYLYAKQATEPGKVFHFELAGTAYTGDPIVLKKTDGGDFPGWNLVGNPYTETAYIDRDFYVMNSQNGGEIITGEGNEIAVMQGFFVIADQDGEELEISTTAPNTTGEKVIMNVTSNRGNVIDRAIIRFGEGRQLPKFQLRENSTKISIAKDNSEYAVVRSEAEGEMPVSFKAENNGTYTFSVNTENVELDYLHLIDNMTGADIDLIANPSYSFEAKVTDYASRFRLVFSANSSINEQNANNFAFFNGNDWTINNEGEATLQVVDMTGRVLSTETVNGNATTKVNAATGVYMLRLINGNNIKTQKVVVK